MAKKLGKYRGKIRIFSILFVIGMAFLFASGLLALALVNGKSITLIEIGGFFISFWAFFSILYLSIGLLDIISKRILIFNSGIELRNIKSGKRTKLTWDAIDKIKFKEELFGDGVFVLYSKDSLVQGIIPFPLKNMEKFIHLLRKLLGNEHILVHAIEKRT